MKNPFTPDSRMRVDLYEAVKTFEVNRAAQKWPIGAEAQRFVDRTLRDFVRSGLDLAPEMREKVCFWDTTPISRE